MNELTKTNPIPGLEILIDPNGLLYYLADSTGADKIAFALLQKYGANPLLDAIKQAFDEKQPSPLQHNLLINDQTTEEKAQNSSSFTKENSVEPASLPVVENILSDPPEMPEDLQTKEEVDEVEEFLSKPKPVKIKQTDKTPLMTCVRPGCGKIFLPKKGQRYCDHRCSQKRWADKNREYTRQKGRERYHSQKQLSSQPEAIQEGE